MNLSETDKNPSLSKDLTVILLRGNGSPRTFRLSLPALQRSLTALGFLFAFALASALFLLLLNIFRSYSTVERVEIPVSAAPAAEAPKPARPSLWQRLTEAGTAPSSPTPAPTPAANPPANPESSGGDSELRKEVEGLKEELSKINGQIDGRKALATGTNSGLLQFFGPRSQAVPESATAIRVKNVKVSRDPAKKEVYVDFELHNVDPANKPARGYIVVLAKTANLLLSYPDNAFNPTQNIVLDYNKGETFGVSRFRPARAVFQADPLEGKKPRFQVLIFSGDGKVIADLHVEEKK